MGDKRIDLTGERFGRLLVTSFSHIGKRGRAHWNVICDCGAEKTVSSSHLRSGHTKSCGCLNREKTSAMCGARIGDLNPNWGKNDLTGRKFGRLIVIERLEKRAWTNAVYLCECACGNFTEVVAGNLVKGSTKSCGCLSREIHSNLGKARVGILSQNWNPAISTEERQATRGYQEYREWRAVVFERDDYTCQKCGKRGGSLIAHHIEWYKGNKELRTEPSNGITLCKKHHDELHRLYGYDVGMEHLNKFIK